MSVRERFADASSAALEKTNALKIVEMLTLLPWDGARESGRGDAVSDLEIDAIERELGVALPPGYRLFLRVCGFAKLRAYELFGLPRHRVEGDIVLANHLEHSERSPRLVKFGQDRKGRGFYFDTSRRDAKGECPVIAVERGGNEVTLARSFADFLDFLHEVNFEEF